MTFALNRAAHVMLLGLQGAIYVAAGLMNDLPNILNSIQGNAIGFIGIAHIIYTEVLNAKNHYAQGEAASTLDTASQALGLITGLKSNIANTLAQLDAIAAKIKSGN